MDSAVQPILCCLGQSVGECPTQYLMELGFADQHLDWRAITVEVERESLAAAIDGARAMGLRGLRFWGETQTLASELLGRGGLPVSSAVATDSGWQAWHTDGYALANLVAEGLAGAAPRPEGPILFVLFGDSSQTRRVYGGLLNKYALSVVTQLDVQISWVGIASDAFPTEPQLRMFESEEACLSALNNEFAGLPMCLVGCPYESAQAFANAEYAAPSELSQADDQDTASTDSSVTGSVVESSESSNSPPSVSAPASRGPVWWLPAPEDVLARSIEEVDAGSIRRISRTDLLLSGEIYDFTRWTAQSISLTMLRDAYDEFNAF